MSLTETSNIILWKIIKPVIWIFVSPPDFEILKLAICGSHFPQYLTEDLTHKRDKKYVDEWMDKDIRITEKKTEKGLDSVLNVGEK